MYQQLYKSVNTALTLQSFYLTAYVHFPHHYEFCDLLCGSHDGCYGSPTPHATGTRLQDKPRWVTPAY
jgi:hypothetical protein